jgi:hypothetical protein
MIQFDNLLEAAESGQKSVKNTCGLLQENAAALLEHDTQVLELLLHDANAEPAKEMAVDKPDS